MVDLMDFKGFQFEIEMDDIIKDNAKDLRDDLKKTSPDGRRKKKKYKQTWRYKQNKAKHEATVYNKDNYRLTHLLEHGHFIVNRKDGLLGWARAKPHIEPAFDRISPKFIKQMGEAPIKMVKI